MDHEAIQELLSSYVDGDLSPEQRRLVEEHLERCAACREDLHLLRETLDALHDLPDLRAPAGFTEAVLARLGEEPVVAAVDPAPAGGAGAAADNVVPLRRRGPPVKVWAPVLVAAAACLCIGSFWWAGQRLLSRDAGRGATVSAASAEQAPASAADDALAEESAVAATEKAWEGEVAPVPTGAASGGEGRQGFAGGLEEVDRLASAEGMDDGARLRGQAREPEAGGGSWAGLGQAGPGDGESAADRKVTTSRTHYAEWEEVDAGDGVADAIAEDEPHEAAAAGRMEPAAPTAGPETGASVRDDVNAKEDEYGVVVAREAERLRREDQALREMAAADGLVDEDDGAWSGGDDLDAVPDDADGGLAGVAAADRRRALEPDVDASDGVTRDAALPGSAKARKSEAPKRVRAARDAEEAVAPAAEAAAPEADSVAGGAAVRAGGAEWTLQTTDAGIAYRVAGVCGGVVVCTWTAPATAPRSLDAQDNYQVLRIDVPLSGYEALKGRLRGLGALLVRTEDVALAAPGDTVVVTLVLEYLP